jgi:hypothetical protein
MHKEFYCRLCALMLAVVLPASVWSSVSDPNLVMVPAGAGNGQFHFTIYGIPSVPYVVESSPDLANWTPVLTNSDSTGTRSITVDASGSSGFYRFWRASVPLLKYAIGTQGNIGLNGNGLSTDSFDSSDTNFSTGGQYDPAKAGTNGDVASIGGIVNIGNHQIGGDLHLGPTATFTSGTNQILGQFIRADYDIDFPDVTAPNGFGTYVAAPISGSGANLTNLIPVSGNYIINNAFPIRVQPGVQAVVFVTTTSFSASVNILGGPTNSGTLFLYQNSGSAQLSGTANSTIRPTNFCYYGLPGVTNVTLTGINNFVGVIYAPEASGLVSAGGAFNAIDGCIVVNTLLINGQFVIHFDRSLLTAGPFR